MDLYHAALEDHRQGQIDSALEKLKQHLAEHPQFEDAYEAASVILYNQKRYDEAMEILRNWIRVNPDAIMAHTNLSRCYVAKGMILEAEHEQAEARKLTWKADLKSKKQEMPKVDYAELIGRYKQVIELDPEDVLGYFSLGNTYLDAGKKREAVDTFERGIEINPQHSASYYGLGLALEAPGDTVTASRSEVPGVRISTITGDGGKLPGKAVRGEIRQPREQGAERPFGCGCPCRRRLGLDGLLQTCKGAGGGRAQSLIEVHGLGEFLADEVIATGELGILCEGGGDTLAIAAAQGAGRVPGQQGLDLVRACHGQPIRSGI